MHLRRASVPLPPAAEGAAAAAGILSLLLYSFVDMVLHNLLLVVTAMRSLPFCHKFLLVYFTHQSLFGNPTVFSLTPMEGVATWDMGRAKYLL